MMNYQKLTKHALAYMYTVSIILSLIFLGIIEFIFCPITDNDLRILNYIIIIFFILKTMFMPFFKYIKYSYIITNDCITLKTGIFFTTQSIVPVERIHNISITKGPINSIFKIANVTVTTAGGDICIKYLSIDKANEITSFLKDNINDIVKTNNAKNNEEA